MWCLILKKFNFSRKRKHKSHKKKSSTVAVEKDEDAIKHGGWWSVKKLEDITGPVCIEFSDQTYVKALDNGLFTLGAPHNEGKHFFLNIKNRKLKNIFF